MMKRMLEKTGALTAAMLLCAGSASAVFFENDLTDASAVSADFMEYHGSQGNSAWSYTNDYALAQDGTTNTFLQGGAVLDWVTEDTDTARSYLGTVYSNWMDHSWTAHVAIEAPSSTKPYIYFGMGDPTPKESYYNEPSYGQSVFVKWQSGSSGSKVSVLLNGNTATNTGAWQGDPGYDLYMIYNHTNKTVRFQIDNWSGNVRDFGTDIDVDCGEVSVDGYLTDTNNMHIFFGANAKVTFGDFDVVEAGSTVEEPEPAASTSRWVKVEAEDYDSQSGTRVEGCSDTGGGTNVCYISNGDWCMYEDIVTGSGDALMKLRVARPDTTSNAYIDVRLDTTDGTQLGQIDVPVTDGWQSWETLYLPVSFTNSTNDVVLVFNETTNAVGGSLFNVNWWSRVPIVEAEDYDDGSGYRFETTSDVGGGQNLGWIEAGEWMEYTINVETAGLHKIEFRVASDGGGDGIAVVSGGETNAVMAVTDTGGWQVWETQSTYVEFTETGEQTVRLEFLSGGFNLNWFTYEVAGDPVSVTVGTTPNQMMRYGIDYERLWYWYGDGLDDVPDWSVNDCNVDYVRCAVNAGYEIDQATNAASVGNYDLSAYTSKIIPMMTAMQDANPNIKWFASPRPLDEAVSGAEWQPYPIWITGAPDYDTNDEYNFNPTNCAQYLIRYLRLMKHYDFKITYLDLTNEWQSNDGGGRFTQADARDLVEYMKAYVEDPSSYQDDVDPTGYYASNYPELEPDDMPLTVAASSWNYYQGASWISNLDTERRRDAVDIASSHNTDKTGSAQDFADQVIETLGSDTEIWETEQHGWKGNSTSSEAMTFSYMIETIRAGFTGLSGWLAIGTTSQGHCYLLNNGTTVTRNVKYYMFKKLSNTSNFGYALDIDETDDLTSTMALIRENLLTIWVINTASDSVLTEFDISGHEWDGTDITWTRWDEDLSIDGDETPEGISGTVSDAETSSFTVELSGRATYCFEIPLVDNEDNFPFVQAESYASGSGVSTASCTDTNGGGMVTFSAADDEITFDLDVTRTYSYGVGFRVASASADIAFDVYDGTNLLASVSQAATGGAQEWTTVYKSMDLDGGPMELKIVANSGGWSLNWVEFESGALPSAPDNVYSTLGNLTVALDWDAVDDAQGYVVKRSTVSGSDYVSLGNTTNLTYTDTTVEAGETYYYAVASTNRYGDNDSDEVTGYGLPYDIIGPDSSYADTDPDLEKDNLFDKDVDTFYDTTTSDSWAGLDFGEGNEQVITQVDYVLRDWTYAYARATNATFEAANSADFSDAVTLFTVTTNVQAYPTVNSETVCDTTAYRYVRLKARADMALYSFAELDITTSGETANGTPVFWLEDYGLTSGDDELDSDGDGLLNWEEYLAGTVPTNSGSVLEVESVQDSADGMVVTWKSVEGISYCIITNGSLASPNKGTAASGIIGADGETSHTTTVNSAESLFFEVGVE